MSRIKATCLEYSGNVQYETGLNSANLKCSVQGGCGLFCYCTRVMMIEGSMDKVNMAKLVEIDLFMRECCNNMRLLCANSAWVMLGKLEQLVRCTMPWSHSSFLTISNKKLQSLASFNGVFVIPPGCLYPA